MWRWGKLKLEVDKWYAWQMLPGYTGEPYHSPIYIQTLEPPESSSGILRIGFYNAGYAAGVRDFRLDLRILWDSPEFLVASLDQGHGQAPDRCAIICAISYRWLARNLPEILEINPRSESEQDDSSIFCYLDRTYQPNRY